VASILIVVALIDFSHYLIPNRLNGALFVLGLYFIFNNISLWSTFVKGGVFFILIFVLFYVVSGGNLGMGDVKLALPLGMLLGSGSLLNFLMITFFSGALVSVVLLLLKIK